MGIEDANKHKDNRYLPFHVYAEKMKIRYNKNLFENDIMYFCKMWKAHRQDYRSVCESKGFANDVANFDMKVHEYETRIKREP